MVSQMKVNLLPLLLCVSLSNVIFGQGLHEASVQGKSWAKEGVFALGVRHKKLECFE